MEKWDGKTKGSLLGYKFFVFCIRTFGISFSYFFCRFVAAWFILFAARQRDALIQFYTQGFGYSRSKARKLAYRNFYVFGQTLIDRIALMTRRKKFYTYEFNNEQVLIDLNEQKQGGILLSGHLGNWENAGNLIRQRITSTINVVMLDAEVEKVKAYLKNQASGPSYHLIPVKNDMSHLISIRAALQRNEMVAIHADRVMEDTKVIELPFLNGVAKFPVGPFLLAKMFKVPITFVYAVKTTDRHYTLSATDPMLSNSEEELAKTYVAHLESMVKKYPEQWFNFYKYYAD